MVRDLAKGEVDPKYDAWFGKRFQTHQRPAKRAHVQQFTDDSQEQWVWLAREEGYRVEIGKLKQQIADLKYENSLQIDANTGEKNRLTQENKALKTRIRRVRMDANNQQRSRADKRMIAGLKNQITEYQEGLERSEASMARIRDRWARGTEERAQRMRQMRRDYEGTIAILRETNSTLKEWVLKQARDARTDRKRCYDLMARMEEQMERFQDQLADKAQVLGTKNQRIEQLLMERDRIRGRIEEIG
ncbi:PREDICTED: uncharacterized protein LOC109243925 isoform X2 [Nicotiana attenuata]|uniref:uncharacterized protein LOC109243925 isoform X2 n=1 Tax=Nicotiana attenuata TaxID=49451 RepID=UPI0009057724|nr:PREDICTED: uncharacterized protein LOC109243925 isoform X2 [Nicotiana attenuata]